MRVNISRMRGLFPLRWRRLLVTLFVTLIRHFRDVQCIQLPRACDSPGWLNRLLSNQEGQAYLHLFLSNELGRHSRMASR